CVFPKKLIPFLVTLKIIFFQYLPSRFGSGLHTFIMYLAPHVALFTIKAVQCGRVDLKSAPYDTILLERRPSWLEKDCLQFGPPIYHETIPFSKILQEVYLEDILWSIGTALGELPPYFLSRTACSGDKAKEDKSSLGMVGIWTYATSAGLGRAPMRDCRGGGRGRRR
ncbi:hypothetical protein ACJX0J_025673, partial [Zea mays]